MNNEIQFLLYQLPDEEGKVQVVIKNETIWATQKAMAQLFGVGVPAISKHLTHIFEEGELEKDVVVSKMEITTQHGAIEGKTQTNETSFYSLDAIIAVGYRVSSARATKFRIWATKILTHQGLVPVPLIIAKRLNSIRGTRRFTKPSQTDGKKSYCWALLMMA